MVLVDMVRDAARIARTGAERTAQLLDVLRELDVTELDAPSALPGWSRLTIVCHLRYGAAAFLRMTDDALAGRESSYYPGGRALQRPSTLVPSRGERADDVLADWADAASRLDRRWSSLPDDAWTVTADEPADNPDLGPMSLARMALARLTEIDVHAVDLDVGFPDWSATLVDAALPARLARLATRRTNHREFDQSIQGSWLFVTDDLAWLVAVDGERVTSSPAGDDVVTPRATIAGSRRDLLALLLGRPRQRPLEITGDVAFGEQFERAFPGP